MTKQVDTFLKLVEIIHPGNIDIDSQLFNNKISITFLNPLNIKIAKREKNYVETLSKFSYVFADGMLLSHAASILRGVRISRLSADGNSLLEGVFDICKKENMNIGIIGSVEGVSTKTREILNKNGLNISFDRNGFFENDDDIKMLIKEIISLDLDMLLVGMGAPYQDFFIEKVIDSAWNGLAISCGGYIDQVSDSDSLMYYPWIINYLSLRWLYRIIKEPRKMINRYIFDYSFFYISFIKSILFKFLKIKL